MLRVLLHTVPRVGRSYKRSPDGFELHLLRQHWVASFTSETLSPDPVDESTRPMAPMPSQWLQRVRGPQSSLEVYELDVVQGLVSRVGGGFTGLWVQGSWSEGRAWRRMDASRCTNSMCLQRLVSRGGRGGGGLTGVTGFRHHVHETHNTREMG